MPYLVNGEPITDGRIRAEEARIRQHLKWRDIPDEGTRAKSIRAEAEFAAIDALLLEQTAARDPRPVDPALVEQQLRALRVVANGRNILLDQSPSARYRPSCVQAKSDPSRR